MGIYNLLPVWFVVFVHLCCLANGESYDYPTANLSTSWKNTPSFPFPIQFTDGTMITSILLRGTLGPRFACGFYCNGNCISYLFAIFIVQTNSASGITLPASGFPQVVWSANRNNPVRENSTLELTSEGDLVLKDVDGTVAWSTGTAGKSVVGLNLTEMGNLVLFDNTNSVVWQSFDHPTDALVTGQKLKAGQKLFPSTSIANWTQLNLLSLSVTDEGMYASVESNPVQKYFEWPVYSKKTNTEPTYVTLRNGSFGLFANSSEPDESTETFEAKSLAAQYLRFESDGHLRLYNWGTGGWREVQDLLKMPGSQCFYPTVCGNYGVCSAYGQCTCPADTLYFNQIDERQPSLGCSETTPLSSCLGFQNHSFIKLIDTTYFSFRKDLENVDFKSCRAACSMNCSCKAAIFQYELDSSNGSCYLPNKIFSLIKQTGLNSTIYLKVQNPRIVPTPTVDAKKKRQMAIVLTSSIVSVVLIVIGISVLAAWKKIRSNEGEQDYLDLVPGLPTRFSYEEIKASTKNFSTMLGEGGFGSVFEGTLADGTKIAVKRLNGIDTMKKSFLAEVESIGSIHHVNLVRLLGFCVNKSNMLLVYEFMCNGSLDKWIFNQTTEYTLSWKQRKKIILDIAKGLNYLHEDCAQKIIHLDIKPQNILLDDKFNAKISDFGLSKIVNRDESKVVTTMRGTRGYLAPEWLSSTITEKVDIYSYGVVVLEMLCGRRNVDNSLPEETMHLLALFETKVEQDKQCDLVDKSNDDMQLQNDEICKMMKIAGWCLQKDYGKRPSISMVIKVLEGSNEVDQNLEYDFSNPAMIATYKESTALFPSVLSGPR